VSDTLRELVEEDSTAILEDDTGFGTDIVLTSPDTTTYSVRGEYRRIGVQIDPATGAVIIGNTSSITVSLSSLAALGLSSPEELYRDGWKATIHDITGEQVDGYFLAVMLDRTAGRATMTLRSRK